MPINTPRRKGLPEDAPQSRLKFVPAGITLKDFHKARDKFIRILIGPLGSSKTTSTIVELLHLIHTQVPNAEGVRKSRWCVVRNTFSDMNSSTIPDFRAVVEGMDLGTFSATAHPPQWNAKYRRKDGTTVEAQVLFRSFDSPGDSRKARGMQLTGCWFNEMAELQKENVDLLMSRVKRYPNKQELPNGRFHILGDSNAPDRDHWLATLALDNTPPNWWIGIQPGALIRAGGGWQLNPDAENLDNLPDSYYTDQIGGKQESWIRKNLCNEFVYHADGRPIHPDFNEQLHVAAELHPTPGIPLYIGIDFGRTPAAVIAQKQIDGQWYILKELCTQNMGADKFGPLLRAMLNENYPAYDIAEITGDPAGSAMTQTRDETPFDLLAEAGIDAYPAYTNDFEVRVASLDAQLTNLVGGEPAFLVDASCRTLIRGLAGEYQYRRLMVTGQERYQDKPDKGPTSHVCEACHYLLLGAGEGDALFNQTWQQDEGDMSWVPDGKQFE